MRKRRRFAGNTEEKEDFSQKKFHEAVLTVGPAPFDIVEEYMWEITADSSADQ